MGMVEFLTGRPNNGQIVLGSRGQNAHLRMKTPTSDQWPDVLTPMQLAGYLLTPRSTACKLAQEGRIRGQKVGRK